MLDVCWSATAGNWLQPLISVLWQQLVQLSEYNITRLLHLPNLCAWKKLIFASFSTPSPNFDQLNSAEMQMDKSPPPGYCILTAGTPSGHNAQTVRAFIWMQGLFSRQFSNKFLGQKSAEQFTFLELGLAGTYTASNFVLASRNRSKCKQCTTILSVK